MKPRISKDAYTGRWQCVSEIRLGHWCSVTVGYGNDEAEAYADWVEQCDRPFFLLVSA